MHSIQLGCAHAHDVRFSTKGSQVSGKQKTQNRAPYSFPVSNNRAFSDRFRAREASSMISSGTS